MRDIQGCSRNLGVQSISFFSQEEGALPFPSYLELHITERGVAGEEHPKHQQHRCLALVLIGSTGAFETLRLLLRGAAGQRLSALSSGVAWLQVNAAVRPSRSHIEAEILQAPILLAAVAGKQPRFAQHAPVK